MLSHFGVIIHLGDIIDIFERSRNCFLQQDCWKWILCEWRLWQYGLSDDNWDDAITDWTVNYIVSSASAALSTTRQTNGLLSSTFALWCNTADLHLRPASITHRNSLLLAIAAAAAAAAAAATTGIYTNWKQRDFPCIFVHQPCMSVLPSTLSSMCTPVCVGRKLQSFLHRYRFL